MPLFNIRMPKHSDEQEAGSLVLNLTARGPVNEWEPLGSWPQICGHETNCSKRSF